MTALEEVAELRKRLRKVNRLLRRIEMNPEFTLPTQEEVDMFYRAIDFADEDCDVLGEEES